MSTTAPTAAARARGLGERAAAWRGAPWAVLAALSAALVVVALRAARGTTFFGDEWSFLLHREGLSPRTFLEPHGQHPVALPVAFYKLWLAIFGMAHYTPYVLALIALHLATCVLVFLYARPRVGAWLALVPTALLIFLGPAWEDVVWAFQVTVVGSITGGVAMLLALDARRIRLACLALLCSCLCSGLGVAFLAVAAVELALTRRWRDWWVVAIPVAVLAVIFLGFPSPDGVPRSAPSHAVRFAIDMGAAGFGAFGAIGLGWGRPLALAAVIGLIWVAHRRGLTPRVLALLAGAAVYWLLTGSSRADFGVNPDSGRYVYLSAVFIVMLAVSVPTRPVVRGLGTLVLAGATALLCLSGAGLFKEGGASHLSNAGFILPKLTALDVSRGLADPSRVLDPGTNPDITVGSYLKARDAHGTPAPSVEELRTQPDLRRQYFDSELAADEKIAPTPGGAQSGRCQAGTDFILPPAASYTLVSGAPVALQLRRLADGYTVSTMSVSGTARLTFPRDRLADPWHLKANGSIRVCGLT